MIRKIFPALATLVILSLLLFFATTIKEGKEEPLEFSANSLLEELTIDDLIDRAELIIIGQVKTNLSSRWKSHNEKDTKNATPQEILEAEDLFTDSLISISQTLKGNSTKPVIRVRTFIGETEQVRWVNSSEPNYDVGRIYLLFLHQDNGPTQVVDPGNYIAVNAIDGVYEIVDGKAISGDDEWVLEELIAYIQTSLSPEALTQTPVPFTASPTPTDLPTLTPLPTVTITPTP
jgi:hypothetical protein